MIPGSEVIIKQALADGLKAKIPNFKMDKASFDAIGNRPYWGKSSDVIPSFERTQIARNSATPGVVYEKSPYSNEINSHIRSIEEVHVYEKNNLVEGTVNGRKTLKANEIDMNLIDERGRNNLERMNNGLAPIGKDGRPLELHHIGQKEKSPIAELSQSEHRSNKSILHDSSKSEVDHGIGWQKTKAEHWKSRAKDYS